MKEMQPLLEHQAKQLLEEGQKLIETQRDAILRKEIELYVGKVHSVLMNGKYIIDSYTKNTSKKVNDILDNND